MPRGGKQIKPCIAILEAIHEDGIARLEDFATVDLRLGLPRAVQLEIIGDYEAIIVKSVTRVDEALIAAAPRLRAVGRAGTGIDNIDLNAAERQGIAVLMVPTGNTVSAAEFTIGLMLNLCRKLPDAFRAVAAGDFRRHLLEGRELGGLTVGLVGLGNVGMAVAQRLEPFGCSIVGWDPAPRDAAGFGSLGGRLVGNFEELLPLPDILSFHVRVTPGTTRMLDRTAIARTRPGTLVVNTSRGAVIDDQALLEALAAGHVAAAALDVIDPEPPFDAAPGTHDYDHPLLRHPKVLVTPHMAASTEDAQRRIAVDLAAQLQNALVPLGHAQAHSAGD